MADWYTFKPNRYARKGDKLFGENTDGKGFMRSLELDAKIDPKGKKVIVLGAGGAARAITVELALAGVKSIAIVNRSETRGQILVDLLNSKTSVKALFEKWEGTYKVPSDTDILINATSIGLEPKADEFPEIDYSSVLAGMLVCDVIPAPSPHFLIMQKIGGHRLSMVWECSFTREQSGLKSGLG